jgi:hypothetical protein
MPVRRGYDPAFHVAVTHTLFRLLAAAFGAPPAATRLRGPIGRGAERK